LDSIRDAATRYLLPSILFCAPEGRRREEERELLFFSSGLFFNSTGPGSSLLLPLLLLLYLDCLSLSMHRFAKKCMLVEEGRKQSMR
jgi:hypothetical protein